MDAPRRRQPSGTTRPGSRSSRRILSGGIPVELGGGVGVLGTVLNDQGGSSSPTTATPTYSYNLYTRSSPTSSSFSSSTKSVGDGRPPPVPPKNTPPPKKRPNATSTTASTIQPVPTGSTQSSGLSVWSTSTTGSATSMYTAPESSSAAALPSAPQRPAAGPSQSNRHSGYSPTASSFPRTAGTDTVRSLEKARAEAPRPLPQMAQGPLPPAPAASGSDTSSLSKRTGAAARKPKGKNVPTPIRTDNDSQPPRLSADWVRVDEFGDLVSDFAPGRPAPAPQSYGALGSKTHHPNKDKKDRIIGQNRAVTEPVPRLSNDLSSSIMPNGTLNGRSSDGDSGRRPSMDEAPMASSSLWGKGRNTNNAPGPTLRTRRSADLLRADFLGLGSKESKEAKAQRAAAAAATAGPADDRKGISLKKSSGALRNLFRGAKQPKEPMPDLPNQPRPSLALSDLIRPNPTVRGNQTPISVSAPFQPESPGRESFTNEHRRFPTPPLSRASSHEGQASPPRIRTKASPRPSTYAEDSSSFLKPSSLNSGPSPSPSYVSSFQGQSPSIASSGKLSPAPDVSPTPPSVSELPGPPSFPTHGSKNSADLRKSKLPPRGASRDALDKASVSAAPEVPSVPSLPLPAKTVSPVGSDGGGSSGSTSTVKGIGESRSNGSLGASDSTTSHRSATQLPEPEPVQMLQLPDFDFNFDFSFDAFGSGSPTTPRRPASPAKAAPATPPRSRSASGSQVLTPTKRAEKRRSKSFDGLANEEPWRALSFDQQWAGKSFTPASSTSAPRLSEAHVVPAAVIPPTEVPAVVAPPAEVLPTSDAYGGLAEPSIQPKSETDSLSTQSSSLDHSRTPSGGSSTNETSSPSPPRTPEDAHAAFMSMADGKKEAALDASLDPTLEPTLGRSMVLDDYRSTPPVGVQTVDVTPTASEQATPTKLDMPTPKADTALLLDTPTPKAEQPPQLVKPQPPVIRAPLVKEAKPKRKPNPQAVHINPAKPPRELEEPPEPEQIPASKAPFRCRPMVRNLISQAKVVMHDPKVTIRDLTQELERSLDNYRYPMQGGGPERSMIIRNELMVYVAEVDRRCYDRREEQTYRDLREVCFDWADSLLFELRVEQPANERGACLEGLAAILESQCLASHALEASVSHMDAFLHLMMRVMNFVMDKLGAKGVFHNTLLFSGRFLAFAFFRIPHVGGQLVGVLQPPRGALMRFTRPVLVGQQIPREAQPKYPEHLQSLCFDDSMSYTRRLLSLDPDFNTSGEKEAFHFQPGNWLRRWQSDDSELFPAFYRAYHKQLAQYLAPAVGYYQLKNKPLPAHVLFRAPGYAHLATIFSLKCHSYILGSVNAVTTSSSNQHFDASESAAFRGSQKPAVLETANRRLVETLWMFASQPISIPTPDNLVIQCDGAQLWGEMVDVWMKNLISKTSLFSPKGVFCLFDLVDGLVDPVVFNAVHSPLDVPYLIGIVRTVLNNAEHALTMVKVIAFVFTHWEILTARPEDRRELCLSILLERRTFERLLLFWSQSVRSYVLRLVVFRLGHLHTTAQDGLSYEVEIESVRLLNTRLDQIKKRYDELEPSLDDEPGSMVAPGTPTTPGMPRSRSTITMVADSPRTISKAERLLGLGLAEKEADEPKGKSSWWKSKFGKQKKKESPKAEPGALPDTQLPTRLSGLSARSNGSNSPRPGSVHSAHSGRGPGQQKTGSNGSPHIQQGKLDQNQSSPRSKPNGTGLGPSLLPADASFGSPQRNTGRKSPPPAISTDGPRPQTKAVQDVKAQFAFEFELPTASPLSDTFESSNPRSPGGSQPASPRGATSPHMSHSFSKRSSLLPPPAATALEGYHSVRVTPPEPLDPGYPKRLHAYAIRMLAELEDAQKEYDEWWSEGGIGKVDGAPPRLAVAWPFHEGED